MPVHLMCGESSVLRESAERSKPCPSMCPGEYSAIEGSVAIFKVLSHDFFFFHNKFALGEYVHVHTVVLKVWFVKCSQSTKFMLKIRL